MQLVYGHNNGHPATLAEVQQHVGPGWADLLARLVTDLEAIGWDGKVEQVKEKFGGLRFYVSLADPTTGNTLDEEKAARIYARITKAEHESFTICEDCGKPGLRRAGLWVKTLCETHYAEDQAARAARMKRE